MPLLAAILIFAILFPMKTFVFGFGLILVVKGLLHIALAAPGLTAKGGSSGRG